MDRIALITGANRGIGLEIGKQLLAREWTVVFTSRNMGIGRPLVNKLREAYKTAWYVQLDVTEQDSIAYMAKYVLKEFGRLDVLFNNADIMMDKKQSALEVNTGDITKSMETNVYGPLLVTRALVPALKKSRDARVINLTSQMGQLSRMGGGSAAYRISKTALNALTVILSKELAGDGISVNTMCPGWVRTDMGSPAASLSPEEGADTAVWLATEPGLPSGKFYAKRKIMDW